MQCCDEIRLFYAFFDYDSVFFVLRPSGCCMAPRCLSQVSLNTATVVTVGVGDFAIIYRDVFARCVGHLKYATNISNNVKSLKKIIKSALQHFWMSLHRDIARYRSYCHPHKLLAITLECR